MTDIIYRPGRENITPDTFSRSYCSMMCHDQRFLSAIHNASYHPGVTRLLHFIRSPNMPYSVEDIRRTVSSCKVCAECRPNFHQPMRAHLIKGTAIPSWLCELGPVLLRHHVRTSRTEPQVDEVELVQANPQYAHIRYPDGKEDLNSSTATRTC
ncbi:uncharacterized protein [Penaeus vannamei]|uniref:uncharacterized protein n=1 Tax=Penaeus vannamei TaxID=6689 RepID=UPI00387F4357